MWQINKIVNEVNKAGTIFMECSIANRKQMQNGVWRIKYRRKMLWVCNSIDGKECVNLIKNSSNLDLSNRERIKKIIKEVIGKKYKYKIVNTNVDNISVVNCIMFSATGELYFYYWNEKVIKKKMSKQNGDHYETLKEHKYWEFFNSPVISFNENYITEKLIIPKNNFMNDKNKYSYVLDSYRKYLLEINKAGSVKISDLLKQYYVDLPDINCIFTQEMMESKVNMYYMHGDMWADNVLQDEDGKYYVIDYDHVGVYPFFFDILEYIWATYINSGVLLFWEELNNDNEIIAQIFNEILLQQGFDPNYKTKFAIMVLMGIIRFHEYNQRFQESGGNKCYKYDNYKILVKFIKKYVEFPK